MLNFLQDVTWDDLQYLQDRFYDAVQYRGVSTFYRDAYIEVAGPDECSDKGSMAQRWALLAACSNGTTMRRAR